MILDRFLTKLGLKSYLDLNAEERATYRQWELALQGRKLTDDDVRTFFRTETEEVLGKLATSQLGAPEDTFLKVKLQFLRNVERFLSMPAIEKAAMEASIARQIEAM